MWEEKTPISDHRGSDASTCLNNGVRDGPLEKLWGGGAGEVQKKDSCKGKLSEENSCMQNRQGKKSCIGLPHILHKPQEGRQESILSVQNISSLNKLPAEFWSCK